MPEYTIKVHVGADTDDATMRQFEGTLQRLHAEHAKAEKAAKAHGGALKGIADTIRGSVIGAMTQLIGTVGLIEWLRGGAKAAMEQEEKLGALGRMARRYGQDAEAAKRTTVALGDSLQQLGIDDDEVIDAVTRLTRMTKDYAQAQSAAALAADFAQAESIPYSEALGIIMNLMTGRDRGVVYQMRQYGIEATTAAEALAKLEAKVRGTAQPLDEHGAKLKVAALNLGDIAKTIGQDVLPAVTWFAERVQGAFQLLGALALWLQDVWETMTIKIGGAAKIFEGIDWSGGFWSQLPKLKENFKGYQDYVATEEEKQLAASIARWDTWAEAVEASRERATGITGGQPKLHAAPTKIDAADAEAARKAREAYEQTGPQGLVDDRNSAAKSKARRDKELKEQVEAQRRADAARVASGQDALDARARQYEAETRIAAALQQSKIQGEFQVAQAVIGLGQTVFEGNKEVSLALAIISAWTAAAGAAADTHGDVYTRIAAYATALAQTWAAVTQIQSTNIGSGGGGSSSGSSGLSVYNRPGGAFQGGVMGDKPSTITTTNNQTASENITINALTGNQAAQAHREFERTKGSGVRQASRAVVNRGRTTITQAGR